MKKTISVLLALVMLLCPLTVAASAAEDDLSLIFVTDVHHCAADNSVPVTKSTAEDPFGYVVSNGKMTVESAAIVDEFLKQAAESDCDYVIVTGDISDNGTAAEVSAITAKLKAFESESGKTVICAMGNHEEYDVSYARRGLTADGYKAAYADLGYDLALDVDPASASYTVDLNDMYRLIIVDTNNFSQARVDWIAAQAAKADADGKKIISVTHFSLFPHYTVQQVAHDSVIDEQYNLADKYIEWGIKFNFSGHTHELDLAEYENGGTVYDITNGALTTYPACYRTAVFAEKGVKIDTKYIEKIDYSLVPSGLNETAASLLQNDFRAYAKKMFMEGSLRQIGGYITVNYLISAAKLDRTRDAAVISLLDTVVPRLNEALAMPLYGEEGLEAIAAKYGFALQPSIYKTLLEVVCEMYAEHCAGDENCATYTHFGKLALNSLAAALNYALEPLSAEDYATVINWALDTFELPFEVPAYVRELAANAVSSTDGIEYIIAYAVAPIIDDFAKDPAPADASVTLPNYGYENNQVYTLLEKFRKFFNMIMTFLNSLFSFLF